METIFTILEWIFWISVFIVFYTYIGYGIILFLMVKIKELFIKKKSLSIPKDQELPHITLLIAAFNEESIVAEKMENCHAIDYPKDKLHIMWVTDGSNDSTNDKLAQYSDVSVQYEPARNGKTAALNRGIHFVKTPLVVFTDANTMLNSLAIKEIASRFQDPKVGCVAGEKRVAITEKQGATAGEGLYWKYESTLKELDDRLYSAVGAAGELFSVRTELFEQMPNDTLLDDFILSLRIAAKGYKIAYTKNGYAIEDASLNMKEEQKRKVRIAAGGLQSVWRLRSLLNPFKYGILCFQYISHRVLRWTITPLLLILLIPLNLLLVFSDNSLYSVIGTLQLLFYLMAFIGYKLEEKELRNKVLFIPYYFSFMNISVLKGFKYLQKNKGKGAWAKAKRSKSEK